MLPSEDKRHSLRVPVDLEATFKTDNHEYVGRILNLSTQGVFLKAPHLFDANQTFLFSFHIPGLDHPVTTKARVMWGGSMEGMSLSGFGMGVRFENLSQKHKEEIAEYIHQLLED
ncbi:MAG TPA: PilZ domain-containing protein [Acidobacteriota bacterium]|nr:PilZ domain-containing protein [Acidobacteriota bacterium]